MDSKECPLWCSHKRNGHDTFARGLARGRPVRLRSRAIHSPCWHVQPMPPLPRSSRLPRTRPAASASARTRARMRLLKSVGATGGQPARGTASTRTEPARTCPTHESAAHICLEDGKLEGDANAPYIRASRGRAGKRHTDAAQGWRTQPPARSGGTDERSIYRRVAALCGALVRVSASGDPSFGASLDLATQRVI